MSRSLHSRSAGRVAHCVPCTQSTIVNRAILRTLLMMLAVATAVTFWTPPAGAPVGTLAIGKPGVINAAILAAAVLGAKRPEIRESVRRHREE